MQLLFTKQESQKLPAVEKALPGRVLIHNSIRKYRKKEEKEMKRKSLLALLLAASMAASMTAATGTVAICRGSNRGDN